MRPLTSNGAPHRRVTAEGRRGHAGDCSCCGESPRALGATREAEISSCDAEPRSFATNFFGAVPAGDLVSRLPMNPSHDTSSADRSRFKSTYYAVAAGVALVALGGYLALNQPISFGARQVSAAPAAAVPAPPRPTPPVVMIVDGAASPARPGARLRHWTAAARQRGVGERRPGGGRRRGSLQPVATSRPNAGDSHCQARRLRAEIDQFPDGGDGDQAPATRHQGRLPDVLRHRRQEDSRAGARAGGAHGAERRGHRRQGRPRADPLSHGGAGGALGRGARGR